jgi:hypothetical protein
MATFPVFLGAIFLASAGVSDSKERPACKQATAVSTSSENNPPAMSMEIVEEAFFAREIAACEIFHKFGLPRFRGEK